MGDCVDGNLLEKCYTNQKLKIAHILIVPHRKPLKTFRLGKLKLCGLGQIQISSLKIINQNSAVMKNYIKMSSILKTGDNQYIDFENMKTFKMSSLSIKSQDKYQKTIF